jgi:hypothetical protein
MTRASAYHGEEAVGWWVQALEIARADRSAGPDRARLCRKLAWLMAATPGAFRSSPDPAVVARFVAEGLAAEDEVSRASLLLARGISARLWRGSEPFGQGTLRIQCRSGSGSPPSNGRWRSARRPGSLTWSPRPPRR